MNGTTWLDRTNYFETHAVAPARARAVARGRPDGHAARRAQPGEPRQPARGRQEREALVVRQPAVRLVPREAPGPPLPAGAPVPPHDDRLDGGPRRGVARGRQRVLPDLLRAEQRGAVGRRRRRPGRGPCAGAERYFGGIPAEPGHPGARRPVAAADARRASSARRSPTTCRCRGSTRASARRSSATRGSMRSTSPARSSPAARAAGSTAGSSARSGSPRTSRCSRSASSAAARSRAGWATVRPGCRRRAGSRRPSSRSSSGSRREPVTDDELARAKALTEADELGALQRVEERADRLSMYATLFDDPGLINRMLPRYLSVTAEADPRRRGRRCSGRTTGSS